MKILKDRQEIARAMNFGKYPVLYLDLAKDKIKGYEGGYEGQRTKTEWYYQGEKYYHHGKLTYWECTNELTISAEIICLKAGFGYLDLEEMIYNANATEVKEEQEVVVVIINSETMKSSYPIITKTSKYKPHCQTAMTIEGDFKEIINAIK